MRELYAAELRGEVGTDNRAVWSLLERWALRHLPSDGRESRSLEPGVLEAGDVRLDVEESTDGGRLVVLEQSDDGDPSLGWRSEIAVAPPGESLLVTVRVRLVARTDSVLAPLDYEFGTPAIVRTLLREFPVTDAGERMQPAFIEIGRSGIDDLVAWLASPARRLPVVVVSRTPDTGITLVDTGALAREMAGIGHVRVLAASQAAWGLTQTVGASLSVWDGAVRVYFPGFGLDDDPRRHRIWFPDRVDNALIMRLRSWLGTLSSSRTPDHPTIGRIQADRHDRLRKAADEADVEFLYSYVNELEQSEKRRVEELKEWQSRNAELERRLEEAREELDDVRRSFGELARSHAPTRAPSATPMADGPPTVATAMAGVEELLASRFYGDRLVITDQALAAGRAFGNYNRPDELLRAVQAVMEAAALYHDDKLGMPPMEFFRLRGFGYSAQPGPHLKVDEATSPDQCLRIHWTVDAEAKRWTVTHIGRHQ